MCAVKATEAGTVTSAARDRGGEIRTIMARAPTTVTTLVRIAVTSVAMQVLITSTS